MLKLCSNRITTSTTREEFQFQQYQKVSNPVNLSFGKNEKPLRHQIKPKNLHYYPTKQK